MGSPFFFFLLIFKLRTVFTKIKITAQQAENIDYTSEHIVKASDNGFTIHHRSLAAKLCDTQHDEIDSNKIISIQNL